MSFNQNTNYQAKYLKYKKKYLDLKMRGGDNKIFKTLKELFDYKNSNPQFTMCMIKCINDKKRDCNHKLGKLKGKDVFDSTDIPVSSDKYIKLFSTNQEKEFIINFKDVASRPLNKIEDIQNYRFEFKL